MALHKKLLVLSLISLSLSILFSFAAPDAAKDREECSEQLAGLATCLPYVSGNAQAPTPDCCSGLKQVLKTKKKCLCVVIKDRNDPGLALSINVTLALGLPSVCNAPANVSQCPALLNLPPNSTDAQVFYQFGHGSNGTASTPVPSAAKKDNPTSANSSGTSSLESSGCQRGKEWLGLEVIVGGVLLMWCYTFV